MDSLRHEAIKNCTALLDLAILRTPQMELPPDLRNQWTMLKRIRNIFQVVGRLDFELLTDRDIYVVNTHAVDLFDALEPFSDLLAGKSVGTNDIQAALHEFDTTSKIMMSEMPSMLPQVAIYAAAS